MKSSSASLGHVEPLTKLSYKLFESFQEFNSARPTHKTNKNFIKCNDILFSHNIYVFI